MRGSRLRCPYCRFAIGPTERVRRCPYCDISHHVDCWELNGGCTTYGCYEAPVRTDADEEPEEYTFEEEQLVREPPIQIELTPVTFGWHTVGFSAARMALLIGVAAAGLRAAPLLLAHGSEIMINAPAEVFYLTKCALSAWLLSFSPIAEAQGLPWPCFAVAGACLLPLGILLRNTAVGSGHESLRKAMTVMGVIAVLGLLSLASRLAESCAPEPWNHLLRVCNGVAALWLNIMLILFVPPAMVLDYLGLAWGQFGVGPIAASGINGALIGLSHSAALGLRHSGHHGSSQAVCYGAGVVLVALAILGGVRCWEEKAAFGRTLTTDGQLVGMWYGKFGNQENEATILVQNENGNEFSGIMTVHAGKGTYRLAVRGYIPLGTDNVAMQETRVIVQPRRASWALGRNCGYISGDYTRMSGTGKDSRGNAYKWSFCKSKPCGNG